ncbi:hypothetical protein PGT21_012489 [Puccinia graminis f. sp. tritici]|uniref:Secreted protein n=1 Tax=Puccinia graminis f. sp. tritici TaxID=56615 RepID=A0A5B0LIQ6_PUCGR|nr:hypothetical protein PGT21_012489 [Puccinia graminis f. sp. tritici]KAA1068179.1 hypothetical protein PGTUg99_024641 [Puccinia graminis f. sp. tritici]
MQLSNRFPILIVLLMQSAVTYVQCFGCQYKPGLELYPNAMCTKVPPAQDINIMSNVYHMVAPWNRETNTYDCAKYNSGTPGCCKQPIVGSKH